MTFQAEPTFGRPFFLGATMYNLDDYTRPWKRALATDSTDTSFPARIPTITEPTGNGVIELADNVGNGLIPGMLKICPIATAGDNDSADLRVIGWQRIKTTGVPLWFPVVLGQFSLIFSTTVGVAGSPVAATERFCDTIIIHATIVAQPRTTDTDSGGAASTGEIQIISAANQLIAMIVMPIFASEKVELTWDSTAAGTTAMNALIALL